MRPQYDGHGPELLRCRAWPPSRRASPSPTTSGGTTAPSDASPCGPSGPGEAGETRPSSTSTEAGTSGDRSGATKSSERASDAYRAGEPATTPTVSPVLADLAGLPPLLVLAARGELLRPDALELTRRAGACGVHVELLEGPGSVHIWPIFPALPESATALTAIGAFVRRCVERASRP